MLMSAPEISYFLSWKASLEKLVNENETNSDMVDNTIDKNQADIINSFGGLRNMIYLCLSHPNAYETIDMKTFDTFESIMSTNNIHNIYTANDTAINNHVAPVELQILRTRSQSLISNISDQDLDTDIIKDADLKDTIIVTAPQNVNLNVIKATTSSTTHSNKIERDIKEYDGLKLIFTTNIDDTLYFHLFGKCCDMWFYNCSLRILFWICALLLLMIIAMRLIIGPTMIYFNLWSGLCIVSIVFCILLILIGNKHILYLVVQTFDFWFIEWNAINSIIAITMLNDFGDRASQLTGIVAPISLLTFVTINACFDAIPISNYLRNGSRLIASFAVGFLGLIIYFHNQDTTWNPFKSFGITRSQISFRSWSLSSMSNLTLFLLKPVFYTIKRSIYSRLCICVCDVNVNKGLSQCLTINHKNKIQNRRKDDLYRCGSLYKRPYINWSK